MTDPRDFPLLVHCCEGAGRTGVFIAFWNLLDEALATNQVDVWATVDHLREFRHNMVQTAAEYEFLHQIIAIACLPELKGVRIEDYDIESHTPELLDRVFTTILAISDSYFQRNHLSQIEENRTKNRFPDGPFYNQDLMPFLNADDNMYINAAFVESFFSDKGIITTQAPLANTVADFWTLVIDQNVSQIVMLNEDESVVKDACSYWPNGAISSVGDKAEYGRIEVSVKSVKTRINGSVKRDFTVKRMKNADKETLFVTQRQVTWPENSLPEVDRLYAAAMVVMQQLKGKPGSKVLIHCADGCGKSGLFAAALNILQRMEKEAVVNVPRSILITRQTQKDFVDRQQLKFLYEVIKKHMDWRLDKQVERADD